MGILGKIGKSYSKLKDKTQRISRINLVLMAIVCLFLLVSVIPSGSCSGLLALLHMPGVNDKLKYTIGRRRIDCVFLERGVTV